MVAGTVRMGGLLLTRKLVQFSTAVLVTLLAGINTAFALPVLLKAASFDPAKMGIMAGQASSSATDADPYWLVQFAHSLGTAQRISVERAGASIVGYIPENCYLVKADRAAAAALGKTEGVIWTSPYLPSYRISPEFPKGTAPAAFNIIAFPGQDLKAIASAIKARHGLIKSLSDSAHGGMMVVQADPNTAKSIASIPGVRWVEPRATPRLLNNVARGIMLVDPISSSSGLYGQGQIVAVADTGLDVGASDPNLHADFQGRVKAAFALGRSGLTNDPNGHGTHVSGSLMGSGVLSGSNPATHTYTTSFAGVAPEAELVMQSILDSSGGLGGLPSDLNTLFAQAYAEGARIHSNSWGANVKGAYDTAAVQVDTFCWNNRDMLLLFAAGNDSSDTNADGVIDQNSLDSPASSKNCIAVAASESLRSTGGYQFGWGTSSWAIRFPAEPIKSDLISDNTNGMAAFSSRGPAKDNRIKPDITAPGTNIISCRSHDPSAGALWGAYDGDYTFSGGTSMATPLTAGAAALIRESYMKTEGISPSAALIKATLLATANDIAPGQYGTGAFLEIPSRPNNVEGWGLVNLENATNPSPPLARQYVDEKVGINTGDFRTYSYTVTDISKPLHVLLTWTDYPGDPAAAQALVNDLDLTVQAPGGTIYNGNGALDRANNVESVFISTPELGSYQVKVSAFNVPQGPQPYALVVLGALPRSYISGTILSSLGSPVPGVVVNAVSGVDTYVGTTSYNGAYTINVPAGSYTVSASRTGWTFAPPSQIISVGPTGVSDIDFTGTAPPASISGVVYSAVTSQTDGMWESAHPYSNSQNITASINGPANAVRIRVHFAQIAVESSYDFVYIRNSSGAKIAGFTGSLTSFWSPWVDGNELRVNLVSDQTFTDYGWMIDAYQVSIPGPGMPGVSVQDSRSSGTVLSGPTGTYSLEGLEPLPTTVAASGTELVFKPLNYNVTPDPGQTVSGKDFVAIPEAPVLHLDISHGYVGDLVVKVGVGNPANPTWSQVISSNQGGTATKLKLDMPLDDGRPYFPPSAVNQWFINVCDTAQYDSGQINSASVSLGGWNWPATDTPMNIPDASCVTLYIPGSTPVPIGEIKQTVDSLPVFAWGKVVSARFADRFYVQDAMRASGIAVMSSNAVNPGDVVTLKGDMGTVGCERVIQPTSVFVNGTGAAPTPLSMIGRSVGGKPLNAITPGFSDSNSLNNIGLLIATTGRVTKTGTDWFYLADGSSTDDASGNPGIRVSAPGIAIPSAGAVVTVTGISGCLDAGYGNARVIYPRVQDDIEIILPGLSSFSDNFESGSAAWTPLTDTDPMTLSSAFSKSGLYSFKASGTNASASRHILSAPSAPYSGLSGWLFDDGSSEPMIGVIELRATGPGNFITDRYAIGVNTNISTTNYCAYTLKDGWTITSFIRTLGWRKLGIRINPNTSTGKPVQFLISDIQAAEGAVSAPGGVTEIVIGSPDGPGGEDLYFDDIRFGFGE